MIINNNTSNLNRKKYHAYDEDDDDDDGIKTLSTSPYSMILFSYNNKCNGNNFNHMYKHECNDSNVNCWSVSSLRNKYTNNMLPTKNTKITIGNSLKILNTKNLH